MSILSLSVAGVMFVTSPNVDRANIHFELYSGRMNVVCQNDRVVAFINPTTGYPTMYVVDWEDRSDHAMFTKITSAERYVQSHATEMDCSK